MTYSHFHLRRLRVIRDGEPAYDEKFHLGVNIISGENGSGKSTLADFIFYILGGEFDNWKTVAGTCDEVQAEVHTTGGILTLRRQVESAQTPIFAFFGSMEKAEQHGLDNWQSFPIRRSYGRESFSQILFRAAGIPEAQSQGAANITMHQVLRLTYSDQRTPSAFLFRYEPFDRREIREAVGDLLCGLSVYELYELELELRDLEKTLDERNGQFESLLRALPNDLTFSTVEAIDMHLHELSEEYSRIEAEIENSEELVDGEEVKAFAEARRTAVQSLRKTRGNLSKLEQELHVANFETEDISAFILYLEELTEKLPRVQSASEIVGRIDFTHCPACLSSLAGKHGSGSCVVCGAETNPEEEKSRYLQIKLDLDVQLRESKQLMEEKKKAANYISRRLRDVRRKFQEELSEYSVRYELSGSPRESFLAERYQRIGRIDGERVEMERIRERVLELQAIGEERSKLEQEIRSLRDRRSALENTNKRRRSEALMHVSDVAKSLLREDIDRQDEFRTAENVIINFGDNSILVDNELNFAESSNVIVKNASIAALLFAATRDKMFFHPRFALFDNIEDKGMEQVRSHNFQSLLVQMSDAATVEHQIIFTTSMLNPSLNDERYVIGRQYAHGSRTISGGQVE